MDVATTYVVSSLNQPCLITSTLPVSSSIFLLLKSSSLTFDLQALKQNIYRRKRKRKKKMMMMGCEVLWTQKKAAKKNPLSSTSKLLREPFHLLTITLLSLLLPLSFLLLARLSSNSYFSNFSSAAPSGPLSSMLSLFLDTNPTLLLSLLSLLSTATLVQCLTGSLSGGGRAVRGPGLYAAWVVLCALQICVFLGIEGNIGVEPVSSAAKGGPRFDTWEGGFLGRVVFFLGLHETMLHWARLVVKPVVDSSVLGGHRDERWWERAAMAAGLGGLWWWRLREEVEALIIVPEVKRELLMGLGAADFVGWWLYYLTLTIGVVKVVKALMWVGMILILKRLRIRGRRQDNDGDDIVGDEDKV